MLKKIIISVLIPVFLLQVIGCYSQNMISKEDLNKNRDKNIRIVAKDKKEYECLPNHWYIRNDTLMLNEYISSEGFIKERIPLASIENIYIKHIHTGEVIFSVIGVAVGIIIIASMFSPGNRSTGGFAK